LLVHALLVGLAAAVGQGFARFAYALLLPPMRAELGWSYAQAGLANSANAAGYLAGALLVGPAVARWGAPRVIRLSLLAVSLSLVASGLLPAFAPLMLWRAISGVGGALIFVAGVAVVLALDSSHRSELPVGVYYAGPGIGIALSGALLPLILGPLGWGWQAAWVALGGLGLGALLLIEPPLRAAGRVTSPRAARRERLFVAGDYLRLWPALTAYGLFGLGYIGYMTFVVAYLRAIGVAPGLVQGFWVLLGVAAAASGFTWRPVVRRARPPLALCAVLAALALGAALPVLAPAGWSFLVSAVLFGSSFLTVITVITLDVRATLPPVRWTAVTGNATAIFALGQLVGPALTGLIADMRGGLALGLLGSAVLLGVAALIALAGLRGGGR
jgi:predicted MFS family arabinose efflux permease